MKLYLSSYNFGNDIAKLKAMMPANNKLGLIDNAKDTVGFDPELRSKIYTEQLEQLNNLGFSAEYLDLKNYFGKESDLRKKLESLSAVWVTGGNTFVLRQAMKLSGFDTIIQELNKRNDFLYGGYSAGICVLCNSLKALVIVDEPNEFPYSQISESIWEGLGFFEEIILPHYDSDHHESADIDKTIIYCKENKIAYRTLRDGEVIIID
ncbi:MAG: Type 1 glutamine amidotransferase-like domain-containing protein [Bacteroidia bacterium]